MSLVGFDCSVLGFAAFPVFGWVSVLSKWSPRLAGSQLVAWYDWPLLKISVITSVPQLCSPLCVYYCLTSLWNLKAVKRVGSMGERWSCAQRVTGLCLLVHIWLNFTVKCWDQAAVLESKLWWAETVLLLVSCDQWRVILNCCVNISQVKSCFFLPTSSFITYKRICCLESTSDITSPFFTFTFRHVIFAVFSQHEK